MENIAVEISPPSSANSSTTESDSGSVRKERQHIQNDKLKSEWSICGLKTDSHLIKYINQSLISAGVLVFCMIQITRDVPSKEIYFSLLSGIVGGFLNNPMPVKKN